MVALAGGVVNDPATWELLLERTSVVWLRASPEEHWSRVIGQGDRRPMAGNPEAMAELRAILAERERLYGQANVIVETTDRAPARVAREIESGLDLDVAVPTP